MPHYFGSFEVEDQGPQIRAKANRPLDWKQVTTVGTVNYRFGSVDNVLVLWQMTQFCAMDEELFKF